MQEVIWTFAGHYDRMEMDGLMRIVFSKETQDVLFDEAMEEKAYENGDHLGYEFVGCKRDEMQEGIQDRTFIYMTYFQARLYLKYLKPGKVKKNITEQLRKHGELKGERS